MERQFRGVYERALKRRGVTGEQMLQILETRLDNVVLSPRLRQHPRRRPPDGLPRPRQGQWPQGQHSFLRPEGERRDRSQRTPTSPARLATKNLEISTSRAVPDWLVLEQGSLQRRRDAHSVA